MDRRGSLLLVGLLVIPGVLIGVARAVPAIDPVLESVVLHLYIVSAIAALAFIVAIVTAVFAARDGRLAPVWIAFGCVAVGCMMLGHGVTTPGVFGRPMNLWIARLPVLALTAFAISLACATRIDRADRSRNAGRMRTGLMITGAGIFVMTVAIAVDPTILSGSVPVWGEGTIKFALLGASAVLLLLVGAVHWNRWRLGRERIELALVLASWLAMAALLSLAYGQLWRVSWWDYHVYLLAGFLAAAWAVVAGYGEARTLQGAVGAMAVHDPVEQVARRQPDALHALIAAVEVKDPYTHGHSARVADLSTRIAFTLSLSPEAVRGLHQGAFLHDVGKIGVPDHVLNKEGSLNDDEWELIRRHPEVGWELVSRADSLRGALSAIRNHHERWDGSGYPDRLAQRDIPLPGRIVAVADVWDALTSDRAYRPAWALDRALSHIAAGSGSLFDPECVEAFLHLMEQEGLMAERTSLDQAALEKDGACHDESSIPAVRPTATH